MSKFVYKIEFRFLKLKHQEVQRHIFQQPFHSNGKLLKINYSMLF